MIGIVVSYPVGDSVALTTLYAFFGTDQSQALLQWVQEQVEGLVEKMETRNAQEKRQQDLKNTSVFDEMLNRWKNRFMGQVWADVFAGKGPAGASGKEPGEKAVAGSTNTDDKEKNDKPPSSGGEEGGSETKRKPKFPQVLISGQDSDPLNPLVTTPFHCDPRHPAVYQRTKDVEAGVYWINTSRPLASKIIEEYTSDSARWRDYMFQRYVDIIVREAVFALGKTETSLRPDDVNRCIDDITTRVQDQAAHDLNEFLFAERFGDAA